MSALDVIALGGLFVYGAVRDDDTLVGASLRDIIREGIIVPRDYPGDQDVRVRPR
ncbi:MAG: hypothetical protein NUW12_07420 [Firmicutes bacterium]|nr:hypothetical protein [Bacillota bacterium]MDH7495980.1 hypothetical protein [Bacillota bacterium]